MGKVLRTIHVVERIRISRVLRAQFYMLHIICKSLNRVSSRENWRRQIVAINIATLLSNLSEKASGKVQR